MQLEAHARTDPGPVRERNEDSFLIDLETGLFLVADGMGGHASGEIPRGTRPVRNYRSIYSEPSRHRQWAGQRHAAWILGSLTAPPLPHHRTYGSRIRRFGGLSYRRTASFGSPGEWK